MNLTITQALDRLKLIKFFRSQARFYNNSLSEMCYLVDKLLPYSFVDLEPGQVIQLKEELKDIAKFIVELDEDIAHNHAYIPLYPLYSPEENLLSKPCNEALEWYENLTPTT